MPEPTRPDRPRHAARKRRLLAGTPVRDQPPKRALHTPGRRWPPRRPHRLTPRHTGPLHLTATHTNSSTSRCCDDPLNPPCTLLIAVLTIATLRLPSAFTMLLGLVTLALALVTIGTLHPAPCTLHPAPCTLHPAPADDTGEDRRRRRPGVRGTRRLPVPQRLRGGARGPRLRPGPAASALIRPSGQPPGRLVRDPAGCTCSCQPQSLWFGRSSAGCRRATPRSPPCPGPR